MSRQKISTTVYLKPEQLERLRKMTEMTGIPAAHLIRIAVDDILLRLERQGYDLRSEAERFHDWDDEGPDENP